MIIGIDASRAFVEDPAGPEYYSLNLVQNIAKIDKINHYILYTRAGQELNFKLPHNFRVKSINMRYLWTQLGLAFAVITEPPDALFIPAHTLPLLVRLFKPRLPIIVTVHGLEGKFLPQSGNFLTHFYRNWSIGWAIRFATKLIAVSEDTKRVVLRSYGWVKNISKKIKVIHEGVDIKRFAQKPNSKSQISKIKAKYKILGDYVLFVGTIQPRKNLKRLIKAFSLAKLNDLDLVIAGKLGWLYTDIITAPRRYGVEDKVKFIGRVDDQDLPFLYKGAKLFVLPSVTEGFGLPILEAQASGAPVICSKAGALPEVAGKGALLINPLSVSSIKEGILKVLGNKAVRDSLIRQGRKNVQIFGWDKTAYNTIKFIEEQGPKS